ncbi:hypothetical protein DUI87_31696 [Hirundo rustica rustica]|uniref:Uncharacterized protein n=1 Tax=Hirundo rustica rustica TaxID=333673 RepID=A0A3M0JB44_HIRRU|nr:hypothetical protein DUI87_31696 [Hirundo rustica rustica]
MGYTSLCFGIFHYGITKSLRLEKISGITESKLCPVPSGALSANPGLPWTPPGMGTPPFPLPVSDHPFHEEIPPDAQPAAPLVLFEVLLLGMGQRLILAAPEGSQSLSCPSWAWGTYPTLKHSPGQPHKGMHLSKCCLNFSPSEFSSSDSDHRIPECPELEGTPGMMDPTLAWPRHPNNPTLVNPSP